eukprot:4893757-Pyramimonas_sp.AAC.1
MQYRQFLSYIKRFGHLAESGSHNIMNPAAHGPSVMHTQETTYMTADMGNTTPPWQSGGPFAPAMSYQTQMDGGYYYDDSDTSDDDGEADAVLFGREEDEPDMSSWSNNDRSEYYYQKYKRYRKKWR